MLFLENALDPQLMLVFYIIFGICLVPIIILALICFVKLVVKHKKRINKVKCNSTTYLSLFGPESNVISVSKNLTRVSVEVKDLELVNFDALKNEGIGVMITGNVVKCSSQTFADQIKE